MTKKISVGDLVLIKARFRDHKSSSQRPDLNFRLAFKVIATDEEGILHIANPGEVLLQQDSKEPISAGLGAVEKLDFQGLEIIGHA